MGWREAEINEREREGMKERIRDRMTLRMRRRKRVSRINLQVSNKKTKFSGHYMEKHVLPGLVFMRVINSVSTWNCSIHLTHMKQNIYNPYNSYCRFKFKCHPKKFGIRD